MNAVLKGGPGSTPPPSTRTPGPTTATKRPTTATTKASTPTPSPTTNAHTTRLPGKNLNYFCKEMGDGLFAYPGDEHSYVQCHGGRGYKRPCPNPLKFNPLKHHCDW